MGPLYDVWVIQGTLDDAGRIQLSHAGTAGDAHTTCIKNTQLFT